jgi:hypothetical protein
MFRKAQAAMEFLMTYGWAILVVLAAIGALAYFGVLNPGNFMKDKCDIPAGLDCIETPVIGTADIAFKITNNLGSNITLTDFAPDPSADCTNADDIADLPIQDGETIVLTYTHGLTLQTGAKIKCKFFMDYVQGTGGLPHKTSVYITGRVS